MDLRRLTDLKEIESIYNTRMKRDFVPNELRPWASLRKSYLQGNYDCYGLFDGDELLGYAYFVKLPGTAGYHYLFDYLAIAENHRDEGLGTTFLKLLTQDIQDACLIIGEVEDPNCAPDAESRSLRERRLQFYLRSGYLVTEVTALVFGVDYRILEVPVGTVHTTEEIRAVYTDFYRSILPRVFFKTCFRLK